MAKKILIGAGVLLVVVLGVAFWALTENHEVQGEWALDLAQVRLLANAMPGDKPTEVRVERVTTFLYPAFAIVTGGEWAMREMTAFSYQLVFPGHTAIVDTAMGEQWAKDNHATEFDAEAFARVEQALSAASLILVTHEHFDHVAGLSEHPQLDRLLPKTRLTPAQRTPGRYAPVEPLSKAPPFDYETATAVAPGVVLVKAPGHTPGSQVVYVQRADGAEFLFLGDVAWQEDNVRVASGRPLLVTTVLGEDRDGVTRQLKRIRRLAQEAPQLHVVPGHDNRVVVRLVAEGALGQKFVGAW